ncbi:hypothetical protein G9A89_002812 [Geosiphon pyriformis]|nr:hypothetical protein G9A89_002812 [Geosiphon pyriformis]
MNLQPTNSYNIQEKRPKTSGNSNNILGQEGMCDALCQYTILISNWFKKGTPIEATWKKAVQQLDSCLHDNNKIWKITIAKIEEVSFEEIREIKNNLPEPIELDWNPEPVINFLDPEQFHKYYQELALIRKEQKQCLEEINT